MRKKCKLVLLALGMISATMSFTGFSYANEKVESTIENNLYTPTVETSVKEEFDQDNAKVTWETQVNKVVQFENNGAAPVFVRMSYTDYWKLNNGDYLPNYSDGKVLAYKLWTKEFDLNDSNTCEWLDGNDGWYYYKKVLSPQQTTNPILGRVDFGSKPSDSRYENAKYHFEFRVEVVQASDDNEVNKLATQQLFKRIATISDEGVVTWV